MKKMKYSEQEFHGLLHEIIRQLHHSDWKPDYIVGITRGGLVPANLLSQYFDCKMETLKVSLRDDDHCESNLWMAEDATNGKNILVVDDINDTGATLEWIKKDWVDSCKNVDWDTIWHNNVRFAVVVNNESSDFKNVDYAGRNVNKLENPQWIVFPWEEWWTK